MKGKKDDRILTQAEAEEFDAQYEFLAQQEELKDLRIICVKQNQRIEALNIHINMLNKVNAARQDKLLKLQENLEQLEKELIKLRCLK